LSERGDGRNHQAVRIRIPITALAALIGVVLPALAFALTARGAAEPGLLVATVGPDFTIRIDDANGQRVQSVPEGPYRLLVHDLSAEHNFVLADKPAGLKVRVDSGVEFVGDKSFDVQLDRGAYGFACSPHWQVMNGTLTVFPAPVATPQPKPLPVLRAGISAGGTATAPRATKPGRYRLVVKDSSKRHNFHLAGPGVNRRTGIAFRGTASWTVRLARGTYRYGSDPEPLESRLRVR
jgi:Copper binding proteins, plastocyanin/azurin family